MAKPQAGIPKHSKPPIRRLNTDVRGREHVTELEYKALRREAGKIGRNRHRDQTMIQLAFHHGLRVAELVRLRWDQVDFDQEEIFIRRVKNSESKAHPMIEGDEIALRRLAGDDPSGWVFKTSRKGKSGHISESAFFKILARAGEKAELNFPVHPHMLRHGCGFWMNKQGHTTRTIQSWLGHKAIQNTVRYTALDADHFRQVGIGSKAKPKKGQKSGRLGPA